MQAMIYAHYGNAEVLQLVERDIPTPKPDEVLLKVHCVSINDWDWGLLRGKPFVNRIMNGLSAPKRIQILGSDVAGEVASVGKNVTQFKPGDHVLSDLCGLRWGGFAEYVCVPTAALTLKPENMSFEQAAAIPQAALLAFQGLQNHIIAGQKVLINGAGGGAGSFALQIAKALDAELTGVDSAAKFKLMRSLGADHVIDYQQEDFTRNGQQYDLILDLMGHHSVVDYRRALSSNGRYIFVGGASGLMFEVLLLGSFVSLFSSKKMHILGHQPNKGMDALIALFEAGKVKPVIDQCYSLPQLPEAMEYFGTRASQGKVVIRVH